MKSILKVENVSKFYYPQGVKSTFDKVYRLSHALRAVDDVSLEIGEGEIYGLLGPNGAGKSTIIKMITGLIMKDSGKIYVDGHDIDTEKTEVLGALGAIIETPNMFGNMSALDNMRYFAMLSGDVDEQKIAAALDTVGLRDRAKDKVRTYSLGMKQRLGIAQAIMNKPKLLVLDEPTNGLDPEWIINIRTLLKRLAREYHLSVLVCSHILGEMQELCDRIGIIDKGRLVKDMRVEEIGALGEDSTTIVAYKVSDLVKAYDVVKRDHTKVIVKNNLIYVELIEKDIPALTRLLMDEGIDIYGIDTKKRTLEDLFRSIVVDTTSETGGGEDAR